MQSLDYFIDSHCHMFTIADVPLYETIRQAAHDNLPLSTRTLLPLISFLLPLINPEKKVQKLEKFMRFFENEPGDSVRQLCDEVEALRAANGVTAYEFTAENTILTPLVMDMDLGGKIGDGKRSKLAGQVERLCAAIAEVQPENIKVLPFIGIDPERDIESFRYWLDKAKSIKKRDGFANVQNGDFIGVKLYPSLGFSPQEHVAKFKEIAASGLPVTVHCQKAGLKLEDDADNLTDPKNWEAVLAALKGEGIDFTINFAHFGGEEGVMETAYYRKRGEADDGKPPRVFDGLRKNSWTRSIIRMLKTYPNAYADLSAFDFADEEAVGSLKWLLRFDEEKRLQVEGAANFPLVKKLMWGSDYPMTLKGGEVTYTKIFDEFVQAMTRDHSHNCEYPPPISLSGTELINRLVCENPKKFHGLQGG